MREYLPAGFTQARKQQEVDKLAAMLQALRNCHRSLATIDGGEAAFLAGQDLESAYRQLAGLHQDKLRQLGTGPALAAPITVDTFEADDWND